MTIYEDYLYAPSAREMGLNSENLKEEGEFVNFFSNNSSRIKFYEIIKEDAQFITRDVDPTQYPDDYTIKDGDIWIKDGSSYICII